MTLTLPALLLLLVASANATLTLVQKTITHNCTTAICSVPVAATGMGNVISIHESYTKTSTGITISSISGGGTYTTPAGCNTFAAGILEGTSCGFTLNSTAGTTSISVTQSGATSGSTFEVREYSFTAASVSFDNVVSRLTTTCNASSCPGSGLALSGTNDVVIQWIATGAAVTAISAPYGNFEADTSFLTSAYADVLNVSNASANPTWTIPSNTQQAISASIAFSEASTGGGTSKSGKLRKLTDDF